MPDGKAVSCTFSADRARLSKAACQALVHGWGIELPRSYEMGFPNANCLQTGCVKATSPAY
jgi:hypothetical protein